MLAKLTPLLVGHVQPSVPVMRSPGPISGNDRDLMLSKHKTKPSGSAICSTSFAFRARFGTSLRRIPSFAQTVNSMLHSHSNGNPVVATKAGQKNLNAEPKNNVETLDIT